MPIKFPFPLSYLLHDYLHVFCGSNLFILILVLPKTTPSSFEDLDVSVMCAMFQYLYEKSPTKGWENDPGDDDKEIADDVKRIRMCRNKISHVASTQMTTEDFNDSVINLIGVIHARM